MAAKNKQVQQLARQLLSLSLVNGAVSAERVQGVLQYVEKHPSGKPLAVLQAYKRLVSIELAKSNAIVEHAGSISETTLRSIEAALSKKYNRPVSATARENSALIAGLRVRIGDDIIESSVAGQLADLAAAV
jgi:F-type H+-transporting ATPase subunit delta